LAIFTQDWTTSHTPTWRQHLSTFVGKPNIRALEIGCYEGRSSIWFLDAILTHPTSHLTCVDPYPQSHFRNNLCGYHQKVSFMQAAANAALRDSSLQFNSLHFAYVDGGKEARTNLETAVLVFPLLRKHGILIFDDYEWRSPVSTDERLTPKLGIDCFVYTYGDRLTAVHRGWQVIVRKNL
jgi:predicted O-methyltransferase YrrM